MTDIKSLILDSKMNSSTINHGIQLRFRLFLKVFRIRLQIMKIKIKITINAIYMVINEVHSQTMRVVTWSSVYQLLVVESLYIPNSI